MKIAACIPSIGRPSVIATVRSLLNQRGMEDHDITVFVADDSRDGAARRVVSENFPEEFGSGVVRVLMSASQNISVARNACLIGATDFDFMLFIDDDQTAADDLVQSYLSAFAETDCDVLFGSVVAVFDDLVPPIIRESGLYSFNPDHLRQPMTSGHTGNAMFRKNTAHKFGVKFLERHGVTGGEDEVFFNALYRNGARLGPASTAVAFEHVPADKCSFEYLKMRNIRVGQTQAIVHNSDASIVQKIMYIVNTGIKLSVLFLLYHSSKIFFRKRVVFFFIKYWQNVGRLQFFLNIEMPSLYQNAK